MVGRGCLIKNFVTMYKYDRGLRMDFKICHGNFDNNMNGQVDRSVMSDI